MKLIARRLVAEGEPRKTFRIMLRSPSRELDLENSWCQRTLCADGTVSESITLAPYQGSAGCATPAAGFLKSRDTVKNAPPIAMASSNSAIGRSFPPVACTSLERNS